MNSLVHGRDFQATHREVFQSLIYFWQKTREEAAHLQSDGKWLLCDRGTLDGVVYWPGGLPEFCERLSTTQETELSRYGAVIHLEVAGKADYEKFLFKNPVRSETWEHAKRLSDQEKEIWGKHPHFFSVPAYADFDLKHAEVGKIVRKFILGS